LLQPEWYLTRWDNQAALAFSYSLPGFQHTLPLDPFEPVADE
jgi:hypothetical protein